VTQNWIYRYPILETGILQNTRSSGVQEFRSSGVQENPEREDLPGDRSDLTGSKAYNPPLKILRVAPRYVGLESPSLS
jgi:hypothetical protein